MNHPLTNTARRLAVLAVALATTLLAACGAGGSGTTTSASSSATGAPLIVGLTYVPDIQFAPFYVGVEKGFFAEEGLDVTLRHHGSSESLFGALQAGTEDVVYAGGGELLQARSEGVDAVSIATMYQHYPVVAIVPADSAITTAADLRGHSIGLPGQYGEGWLGLLMMLKTAGLTRSDVDIQNIGYTLQAALPAGRVDAVIGYSNNDAVQFEAAGFAVRTIPVTEGEVPLVSVGLETMRTTLDANSEALTRLNRAAIKATQYVIDHPDEAVELSAAYVPNLSADAQRTAALATLNATIPLFGTGDEIGAQHADRWAAMATFMDEAGLLTAPVDSTEAFVTLD